MISVSKNVCIFKLDDKVDKWNNTYPKNLKILISIKPVDLKSNTYFKFSKETNDKDPKFKIDGIVRIPKCKNIFANSYFPNWCEEVFLIKNVENTVLRLNVTSDRKNKAIVRTFYKKELPKKKSKRV